MENVKAALKETKGQFWLQANKFVKRAFGTAWGWAILILLLTILLIL